MEKFLTPKNIKSDFKSAGISPFDSEIFTEADCIVAENSGENQAVNEPVPEDDEHRILMVSGNQNDLLAHKEPSEIPSTSGASKSSSPQSTLGAIGSLQLAAPRPKSNPGRKLMRSCILSSPENLIKLTREKRSHRKINPQRNNGARIFFVARRRLDFLKTWYTSPHFTLHISERG